MENTKQYIERGRAYRHLTVRELEAGWARTWRGFFLLNIASAADDNCDYEAELRLRKLPRPAGLLGNDELQVAMMFNEQAVMEDLHMQNALREDLVRFSNSISRPKN